MIIIAVPVVLTTIGTIGIAFSYADWWPVALLMLYPASVVVRANTARTDYLNWRKAWESMGEPAEPAPRSGHAPARRRPWLGGLMLAGIGLFLLANASDPLYRIALAWLVAAVAIAGLAGLIWRPKAARRHRDKTVAVTVCVGVPLMPVPSLRQAYRAVPEHCLTVLGITRR